uniref:Uncharacterized protein n=1 Tax=Peronospora matthiolae TaxID=2874970 RepID=A0AAV1U2P6_9STRA
MIAWVGLDSLWPIFVRGGKDGTEGIHVVVSLEVPGDVLTDVNVEPTREGNASLAEVTTGEAGRGVDDVDDVEAIVNVKKEKPKRHMQSQPNVVDLLFAQRPIVIKPVEIGFKSLDDSAKYEVVLAKSLVG